MDTTTWVNIGLVFLFILIGGVFAGTEIALVSLRESRLDQLERESKRGARVAKVARDPNRFLGAVQIGVTLAGFFSAAYGASAIAPDLVPVLEGWGVPAGLAANIAVIALTLVIAYLSLVFGELVPKRIALQRAAGVALVVTPPLDRFASLMRPVIWLLSVSTNAVVRLLGGDPGARGEELSDEELRGLVLNHESLAESERKIVDDLFETKNRTISEVMRPRGEVAFMPADLALPEAVDEVSRLPYSRYPVTGDDFDDVLGFLHARDLIGVTPEDPRTVRDVLRPIAAIPGSSRVLPSLSRFREMRSHIAVVVDEYGGTDGIVTLEDLVEEFVGDIQDEYDPSRPRFGDRPADSGEFSAGLTLEEFADRTAIELEDGSYETVGGFVAARLGRVGDLGDVVALADGRQLRITEVDGWRIVRVFLEESPVDEGTPSE